LLYACYTACLQEISPVDWSRALSSFIHHFTFLTGYPTARILPRRRRADVVLG